jgi:small subunit ribosomal protein S1
LAYQPSLNNYARHNVDFFQRVRYSKSDNPYRIYMMENPVVEPIDPESFESETQWFELLEEYAYTPPEPGQILTGRVMRIENGNLLIDVGMKREAIVLAQDLAFLPEESRSEIAIGFKVRVSVVQSPTGDQDLIVSLTKGFEHDSWKKAQALQANNATLDLVIIGLNKGGLLVNFDNLRGFIPNSKVPELRNLRDQLRIEKIKKNMVGTHIAVKVIEVDQERDRLVFSAEAAAEEQRKRRFQELEKGQIIHGKAVTIVDFGIFVDLGGVDGLIHISELDWYRVDHPSDVLKIGDEVDVIVTDVDKEREQVSLSRKALLPNPWERFAERFKTGDLLEGRITNIVDFGAFVELPEGIQGLIPNREIGYSATSEPQNLLSPNQSILVRIVDIEPKRERVSLSMRRVPIEAQIAWTSKQIDERSPLPQAGEISSAEGSTDPAIETGQNAAENAA